MISGHGFAISAAPFVIFVRGFALLAFGFALHRLQFVFFPISKMLFVIGAFGIPEGGASSSDRKATLVGGGMVETVR